MFGSAEEENSPGSQYFRINRLLLYSVGLWPPQKQIITKPKNVVILLLLLSGSVFQLNAFVTIKFSIKTCLQNIVTITLSLAFTLKYLAFLLNMKEVIIIFEELEYDWNSFTNENELRIIHDYYRMTKKLTPLFALVVFPSALAVAFNGMKNQILDLVYPLNYSRPREMPLPAVYFVDQEKYYYLLCTHEYVVMCLGVIVLLGTESTAMMVLRHICSLLKIASYRLEHMFDPITPGASFAQRSLIIYRRIVSIVELHRRVIKYIHILRAKFSAPYFILLGCGTVCITLTFVQLLKALQLKSSLYELLASLLFVFSITCYMFIANHFAQDVLEHISYIYHQSYNSQWYNESTAEQKSLLFIMLNSFNTNVLKFVTYIPSYEGFGIIMKTCFSYAMVIYSIE